MTASVEAGLRTAVGERVAADADVLAAGLGDRAALRRAVARALAAEGVVAAPARWAALVRALVDDLAGLGPLEELLRDPAVTDVCCNGPDEVWVERAKRLSTLGRYSCKHGPPERAVLTLVLPSGVLLTP